MITSQLEFRVVASVVHTWDILKKKYPSIQKAYPKVVYNRRLKTTAGRAFYESRPQYIDVSVDLLLEYPDDMIYVTIPHELAHLAAWTVYNEPNHGAGWKIVMRDIGLPPDIYHNMVNSKHEVAKLQRMK